MPTHPDAIGYLNDLLTDINQGWFTMACDLASIDGLSVLGQEHLKELVTLFVGRASYIGCNAGTIAPAPATPAAQNDFLEQLTDFADFKRLKSTLDINFSKRVTLVFGANGSGKSSLCESLKVLSTTALPIRPLENVHGLGGAEPTFDYKFKNDTAKQTWTPTVGYGTKQETVKYFDTAIAVKNVTSAVDPGRVIALTPFKLNVFEWVTSHTSQLRGRLQQLQSNNSQKLAVALEELRTSFEGFATYPLAKIDEKTVSCLSGQIKLGEEFKDQKDLKEKRETFSALKKAASDEGLRLLKAEYRELESFQSSVNKLAESAHDLWELAPAEKAVSLKTKLAAQAELAKALIPEGSKLDEFLELLRATSPLCTLDEAEGETCPLCKRELGNPEIELFKKYHDLLVGKLETESAAIKADIDKAKEYVASIKAVDRLAWDKLETLPEGFLESAKADSDLIVACCSIDSLPSPEAKAAFESLKKEAGKWAELLSSKNAAIEAAKEGAEALAKKLATARAELEPLEYANAISEQMDRLHLVKSKVHNAKFWDSKLPEFRQVLRKITEKSKVAHEELVVVDFETRLDSEYRALTEKSMATFGVELTRRGADSAVTVTPKIGGNEIKGVLSEGEQRVHALALFFAELETCSQSVVVFDDPVSSFDYNYIANYSSRLRDFTMRFPDKQIIILTHNWEFFVQLQTTLNSAGLNGHLSVQVLENCAVVADYSEKSDDLKGDIVAILGAAGEPGKPSKEEMAGKMRRLIEAVVNTHVFNNQRHQYKQKSQPVSTFHSFTQIVPLLPTEATTLRDLYAKLSITEHDDLRNAYVNTDKATFQTRYNAITAIETALIARR